MSDLKTKSFSVVFVLFLFFQQMEEKLQFISCSCKHNEREYKYSLWSRLFQNIKTLYNSKKLEQVVGLDLEKEAK